MLPTIILLGLLQTSLLELQANLQTPVAHAEVVTTVNIEPPKPISNEEKALSLIKKYATQYKVSAQDMERVMRCENKDFNPTLQSFHRYKNGEREKSFGVSQIHLPAHPEISYEQATNMEFSIEFMAKEFSKGNQKIWSCWKIVNTPSQGD